MKGARHIPPKTFPSGHLPLSHLFIRTRVSLFVSRDLYLICHRGPEVIFFKSFKLPSSASVKGKEATRPKGEMSTGEFVRGEISSGNDTDWHLEQYLAVALNMALEEGVEDMAETESNPGNELWRWKWHLY